MKHCAKWERPKANGHRVDGSTDMKYPEEANPERHKADWQLPRAREKFGLPWWLSGKESACIAGAAGNVGLIPGSRRSPWQPTPVFLPGESHEERVTKSWIPWSDLVRMHREKGG